MVKLIVDIKSYWHAGTGRSAGSQLDAVVETDYSGLPFLPGRSLKGQLRDAVLRAEAFGWFDQEKHDYGLTQSDLSIPVEYLLFGTRANDVIAAEQQGKRVNAGLEPIRITSVGKYK